MIYRLLIITFIAFYALLPVHAGTKKPVTSKATTNSTSSQPGVTSYFNRDPQGNGTYEFGYQIKDNATSKFQFHNEKRLSNGTVTGSYGYRRPDGKVTVTDYVADKNGYRPKSVLSKSRGTSSTTTEMPGINLNSGTLPPQVVKSVMEQYQIDLRPHANPSDVLDPNILNIVNGKVPLTMKGSELGYKVVNNFIPESFPLVPFQLPNELPIAPKND